MGACNGVISPRGRGAASPHPFSVPFTPHTTQAGSRGKTLVRTKNTLVVFVFTDLYPNPYPNLYLCSLIYTQANTSHPKTSYYHFYLLYYYFNYHTITTPCLKHLPPNSSAKQQPPNSVQPHQSPSPSFQGSEIPFFTRRQEGRNYSRGGFSQIGAEFP